MPEGEDQQRSRRVVTLETVEAIMRPRAERPDLRPGDQRWVGRLVMSHTCLARDKWFKGRANRDDNGQLLLKYKEAAYDLTGKYVQLTVSEGRVRLEFHGLGYEAMSLNVVAFNGSRENTTIEMFQVPKIEAGTAPEMTTTTIEQMDFKQVVAFKWLLRHAKPDLERLKESRLRTKQLKKPA